MTDARRPRQATSLHLDRERSNALQSLARDLGLMVETGPGAGQLGSLSALCRALAAAYQDNPDHTRDAMRRLLWPAS